MMKMADYDGRAKCNEGEGGAYLRARCNVGHFSYFHYKVRRLMTSLPPLSPQTHSLSATRSSPSLTSTGRSPSPSPVKRSFKRSSRTWAWMSLGSRSMWGSLLKTSSKYMCLGLLLQLSWFPKMNIYSQGNIVLALHHIKRSLEEWTPSHKLTTDCVYVAYESVVQLGVSVFRTKMQN